MHELDDLRVFARVAALRSFSAAARDLGRPKSSISRAVARLEGALGARLIQRTTREVALTPAGSALVERSGAALGALGEAMDYVGGLAGSPKGVLRISCGIGFGINILAEQLPVFVARHPQVDLCLDLSSRFADLVQERVDVAIRLGPIPDSSVVTVRLGEMTRKLCAAPSYLARRGTPGALAELSAHDWIEMPAQDGRPRNLPFTCGNATTEVLVHPRIEVNEALTVHRLCVRGAGMAIISSYVCAPELERGELVHLLPQWSPPPVGVSLVFPSKRELSPTVRAFVNFMREMNPPDARWRG